MALPPALEVAKRTPHSEETVPDDFHGGWFVRPGGLPPRTRCCTRSTLPHSLPPSLPPRSRSRLRPRSRSRLRSAFATLPRRHLGGFRVRAFDHLGSITSASARP